MTPLVKIRSERDSMSAIERRIADFILDNTQLLRDYSSQQLANAVGISQSSVIKFAQKLGFKGYPDLKYSIGEATARAENGDTLAPVPATAEQADPHRQRASALWRHKSEAEEATRMINPPETLDAVAEAIGKAGKVFIIGLGRDDLHARAAALRLSMLGVLTLHNFDTAHMTASISAAARGDVLLVFSEYGTQPALCEISRWFRERHGTVVTVTRHTPNPLRAHANLSLLVSAHDERAHIEPLLYHSALQHLMDGVFVLLCEGSSERSAQLKATLDRIQPAAES
ncbi:MAG TPA: MurR/RpiR family transcriptional regulator [Rhodanobacteraceae bacterium]|nr:MurR/RpiR family transcriptional regulator [Rhodanobacteraceae bacterium]